MSIKIAFSGYAAAGKDLAADYLQSKHPGQRLRFAAALHDIARPMFEALGLPYEKDRELLQFLGTDWGRRKHPGIWIKPVLAAVAAAPDVNQYLSDCRFTDEADALKAAGFLLVRIERKHLPDPTADWRKHPSEHDLDAYAGFDYVIKNCGDLDHYLGQLDALWDLVTDGTHTQINFRTTNIA